MAYSYRPEIDGLRAFAVLPVIFFHAGFSGFSGGYVGVDIFFVISGYLITSIILTEKHNNTFSIVHFYERRIRRIVPALVVMIIFCIPFAWYWMVPAQLLKFSESLIALAVFAPNLLFYSISKYFNVESDTIPLLHTWSLGVEEQYYLFFPLFIVIFWKLGLTRLTWILAAVAVFSLSLSAWCAYPHENFNFYLIPTRAWELLLGALLAFFTFHKSAYQSLSLKLSNFFAMLGLISIFSAFFLYDDQIPAPSFYTLVPTLGATLILAFGYQETIVGKLLSLKWVVALGLISYSLYLWHQPIFAFARIYNQEDPSQFIFGLLCILSILFAYLSWRYIEKPFRHRDIFSRHFIFTTAVCSSISCLLLGGYGYTHKGFPNHNKLIEKQFGITRHPKSIQIKKRHCDPEYRDNKQTDWVIVGDSHARALTNALWSSIRSSGACIIPLTKPGCLYAPGSQRLNKKCTVGYQSDRRKQLLSLKPSIVVIHSKLGGKVVDNKFTNNLKPSYIKLNSKVHILEAAIIKSVHELLNHGHTVILVYPVPQMPFIVPNKVFSLLKHDLNIENIMDKTSIDYSLFQEYMKKPYEILDKVGSHPRLIRVYPEDIFCNTRRLGRCESITQTSILYADDNHLSESGAALLSDKIMQVYYDYTIKNDKIGLD